MRQRTTGISCILAKMTVLPLLLFGIVTTIFSLYWVSSSLESEVQNELKSLAGSAIETLDLLYPGEYAMYSNEDEILVVKGDTILNSGSTYAVADTLKERTNVDYTLFYVDMRIFTTLYNEENQRLIGTTANPTIVHDVMDDCTPAFYSNVDIFGKAYHCYYTPLFNSDGTCIGMFATTMSADRVRLLTIKASLPIFVLALVAIGITFLWSFRYSREFVNVIQKTENTFQKASKGLLSNTVPPELLARKDEFGSMSHSLVDMQSSLRLLIEQDALTGLSNRRFGQQKLDQLVEQNKGTNKHFSLAMGDIDFFKKFNDTYGHDCGDLVLQIVSQKLRQHIKDYGYCIRWGGEEFLIVLTKGNYTEHVEIMQALIERIRDTIVDYADLKLSVTMTFGLIDTFAYRTSDEMVKTVDNLLYFGKANGRNRLVTMDEVDTPTDEIEYFI